MENPGCVFLCQTETEIVPDFELFLLKVLGFRNICGSLRGDICLSACVWLPGYLPANPISLKLMYLCFSRCFFVLILSRGDHAAQNHCQVLASSAPYLGIFHPHCGFCGFSALSKTPAGDTFCVHHISLLLDSVHPVCVTKSSGMCWCALVWQLLLQKGAGLS